MSRLAFGQKVACKFGRMADCCAAPHCWASQQWHTGGYNVRYDLNLLRTDQTKLSLLTLEVLDQVLYLDDKIEERLRIDDQRIPGEVRK